MKIDLQLAQEQLTEQSIILKSFYYMDRTTVSKEEFKKYQECINQLRYFNNSMIERFGNNPEVN